jgi:hypothetical protein
VKPQRSLRSSGACFLLLFAVGACARSTLAASGATENPIEISGRAWRRATGLDIALELRNSCRTPLGPLSVEAELLGQVRHARIEEGLAPGTERALLLQYSRVPPRPGVYPLVLLFEHTRDAVRISRRGCLLLSLGEHAAPALRVSIDDLSIRWQATTTVSLASLDGRPHRVELRVLSGRGLVIVEEKRLVSVPAVEPARVPVRVLYAGARRSTLQGLLALASAKDGEVERTSVASAIVHVQDDRPWLSRLKWPLAGVGFVLLAFVVAFELGLVRGRAGR